MVSFIFPKAPSGRLFSSRLMADEKEPKACHFTQGGGCNVVSPVLANPDWGRCWPRYVPVRTQDRLGGRDDMKSTPSLAGQGFIDVTSGRGKRKAARRPLLSHVGRSTAPSAFIPCTAVWYRAPLCSTRAIRPSLAPYSRSIPTGS
ncbi:hypothetical protein D3C84_219600 [compost metagenome]